MICHMKYDFFGRFKANENLHSQVNHERVEDVNKNFLESSQQTCFLTRQTISSVCPVMKILSRRQLSTKEIHLHHFFMNRKHGVPQDLTDVLQNTHPFTRRVTCCLSRSIRNIFRYFLCVLVIGRE